MSLLERHRTSLENNMYRAMNQVERLERIEKGEHLPAPVAVDVAVHSDPLNVGTNVEPPKMVLEDSKSEPTGERDKADGTTPDCESS